MKLDDFKRLTAQEQEAYYQILTQKRDSFYELMCHRCQEDTKINKILWDEIKGRLNELYS